MTSRDELYKAATDQVKELYASEASGELLWEVAGKIGINGGRPYRQFAMSVGDVILGIYKKESLPQLLKDRAGFSEEQIKIVIDNLAEFLEKIPDHANAEPYVIPPTTTPEPSSVPVETPQGKEVNPNIVKPLRTFAEDIGLSRAHGYGAFRGSDNKPKGEEGEIHRSSQDDIIKP